MIKLWCAQENAEYWTEMARVACIMNGFDGLAVERYLADWYRCFDNLEDNSEEAGGYLSTRLSHTRYEHIAPILGLPIDNGSTLFSTFFWHPFSIGIAEMTSYLLELPEWQAEIEKMLP